MKNKVLEAKLKDLGVLDKFLANTSKCSLEKERINLHCAFYWGISPEGFKFWSTISEKLDEE